MQDVYIFSQVSSLTADCAQSLRAAVNAIAIDTSTAHTYFMFVPLAAFRASFVSNLS